MLNHRIRALLFHYKKKCYFAIGFYFFGKSIQKHPDSVCENEVNNEQNAGIICQTIEREVEYSTAKKIVILASFFFSIVNLFSIVKIRFIRRFVQSSHKCYFISRYSPCSKPVKQRFQPDMNLFKTEENVKYLRLSITFVGF